MPLQNVRNQAKPKSASGGFLGASTIPVGEVHFDINLRTLAQGTMGLQILVNRQNGDQKAESFKSNTAKLANLDMCHPPEIYS